MDREKRTSRSRITACIAAMLAVGLGCLCLPTTPLATETPIPPPGTSTAPVPSEPLNAGGPWLLIETAQGLWAMNPDGSGLTQLTDVDYWQGYLQDAVQPGGDRVVFLTGTHDFSNMALNVLRLPDGSISKVTDLTSPESEAFTSSSPGDAGFEALRAIGEQASFAWSPDGSRLAFSGVMEGPSADIYLYQPGAGGIQRVSQGEDQDVLPSWSPDGNHLVYLAVAGFGTGAGWAMSGVWVADGNGSNPTQLYPAHSGGEEIIGWLDDTTALIDTWRMDCGPQELRLYNVVSRQETMLNEGCITSAAADAWTGTAMFSNESGVFMVYPDNPIPVQVSHEAGSTVDPQRPNDRIFTVRYAGGGLATYGTGTYDNQVSPVPAPADRLHVIEYGAIWGWTSADDAQPGVWITGPGIEIGQIFTGRASLPTWDLHNNLLFFAPEDSGGYSIYRTTFDAYYRDLTRVNFIDANLYGIVWLGSE